MLKTSFKILLPFVAILYCVAFFEIEIGDVEQTWGDQYDTYVTASYSANIGNSYDTSVKPELSFTPLHALHSFAPLQTQILLSKIDVYKIISSSPQRLFIKNCTWLI